MVLGAPTRRRPGLVCATLVRSGAVADLVTTALSLFQNRAAAMMHELSESANSKDPLDYLYIIGSNQ